MNEKRKSIRFILDDTAILRIKDINFKVLDVSISGMKLDEEKIEIGTPVVGEFFYKEQSFGLIEIKKVNNQTIGSGWEIRSYSDQYQDIFNPNKFIKNIKIKRNKEFIEYSDAESHLKFNFFYNDEKQITKTIISFRNLGIELHSNSMKTFFGKCQYDRSLNHKTIQLITSIISESNCFVSSFKDWLVDSININS